MEYTVKIIKAPSMALSHQLFELQKRIWGVSDKDALPAWKIFTTPKTSGLLIVAFEEDKPIAYALFTHVYTHREAKPYLYMDMLGVLPEYQGQRIGEQIVLKVKQFAKKNGYSAITWTYDPFQPANAHLYLCKLGAVVTQFYPNYYGELSGTYEQGSQSDRFLAELHLDATPKIPHDSEITVSFSLSKSFKPSVIDQKGTQAIEIEVPFDINTLMRVDAKNAYQIKDSRAEIFKFLLESDYCITDFVRKKDANYYIAKQIGY